MSATATDYAAKAADEKATSLEQVCAALADCPAVVRAIRAAEARGIWKFEVTEAFGARNLDKPNNPYGGNAKGFPPYTLAMKPTGCKLLRKRSVDIEYRQEAYADTSIRIIPAILSADFNREQAQANLNALAKSLQSHNGWAGSGSTYSFSIHVEVDGAYVLMHTRASISD